MSILPWNYGHTNKVCPYCVNFHSYHIMKCRLYCLLFVRTASVMTCLLIRVEPITSWYSIYWPIGISVTSTARPGWKWRYNPVYSKCQFQTYIHCFRLKSFCIIYSASKIDLLICLLGFIIRRLLMFEWIIVVAISDHSHSKFITIWFFTGYGFLFLSETNILIIDKLN